MILDEMDFIQFQEFRSQWIEKNPNGLDLANTSVYGWKELFPKITPVVSEKSQYRCHLAEEYLDWLALEGIGKENILVSSGVRHSLAIMLRQTGAWMRPDDVYPQYGKIEHACGAEGMTYSARTGLPWRVLENSRDWNLLVCDPLKPWGGQLEAAGYRRLVDLAVRKNGTVWIDGAYAKRPHRSIVEGIARGLPVVWMSSLSKGWLNPWVLGVVLGHPDILAQWKGPFQAEKKDTVRLGLAWDLLISAPQRPDEVENMCRQGRIKLLGLLDTRGLGMGARDPGHGYMLWHELCASKLIEEGVLALPGSVFLDKPQEGAGVGSILSAVGAVDWPGSGSNPAMGGG